MQGRRRTGLRWNEDTLPPDNVLGKKVVLAGVKGVGRVLGENGYTLSLPEAAPVVERDPSFAIVETDLQRETDRGVSIDPTQV